MSNKELDHYFDGKPETYEIFKAVKTQIDATTKSEGTVGSQISFGTEKRKFAWFWLYNVTQKNPNGILHVMLAIDHMVDDSHVRNIEQIGKNRWNHQIVIRTLEDAQSNWLSKLIECAAEYGNK